MMANINQQQQIIESNSEQMQNIGNDGSEDTENSQDDADNDNQISKPKSISDESESSKKSSLKISDDESATCRKDVMESQLNHKHLNVSPNEESTKSEQLGPVLDAISDENSLKHFALKENDTIRSDSPLIKDNHNESDEKQNKLIEKVADVSLNTDSEQINNNGDGTEKIVKNRQFNLWSPNRGNNDDSVSNLNENSKSSSDASTNNKIELSIDGQNSNACENQNIKPFNKYDEDNASFKFSDDELRENNHSNRNSVRSSSPSSLISSFNEEANPQVENDNVNIFNTDENANLQNDAALSDSRQSENEAMEDKESQSTFEQTLSPKMNGEHKTLLETEYTNNQAVITKSETAEKLKNLDENRIGSFKFQGKVVDSINFEQKPTFADVQISSGNFSSLPPAHTELVHTNAIDDSRSSVGSPRSCSTNTSFSDQLVIDQPAEALDSDSTAIKPDALTDKKQTLPLKVTLKRKFSSAQKIDESTRCKQPYVEVDQPNDDNDVVHVNKVKKLSEHETTSANEEQIPIIDATLNPTEQSLNDANIPEIVYAPCINVGSSAMLSTVAKKFCIHCHKLFDNSEIHRAHLPECISKHPTFQMLEEDGIRLFSKAPVEQAKRVLVCRTCSTHHELWNMFLHMSRVHKRLICSYCNHSYATVEKLSLHLEIIHDVEQEHFHNENDLLSSIEPFQEVYLTCCTCQHTFLVTEKTEHICTDYLIPCELCGQKGRHTNECAAHPNAKRLAKVKKKKLNNSAVISTATPYVNVAQSVQQSLFETNMTSVVCDKIPIIPPSASDSMLPPPLLLHSDSGNHSASTVINEPDIQRPGEAAAKPFNENHKSEIYDPQMGNISNTTVLQDQDVLDTSNQRLVVPKIKLCVPKEFQRAISSKISSPSTDDDEEEDESSSSDNESNQPSNNLSNNATIDQINRVENVVLDVEEGADVGKSAVKIRLLAEAIKRTEMDIEETKGTKHSSKKSVHRRHSMTGQPDGASTEANWSPTPPTSPSSRDCTQYESTTSDQVQRQSQTVKQQFIEGTNAEIKTDSDDENSVKEEEEFTPVTIGSQLSGSTETSGTSESMEQKEIVTEIEQKLEMPLVDEIKVADETYQCIDIQLDGPLSSFDNVDLMRIFLRATFPLCIFCNHARRIAVNGKQLVLHMIAEHRFTATVESITAEELKPSTIVTKLKSVMDEVQNEFFNLTNFNSLNDFEEVKQFNERVFECFRCRLSTVVHKELYLHNRKEHMKAALLCLMCRSCFYSFSELLCHLCPGTPINSISLIKYRCCFCNKRNIPSAFRLMVHLRKEHNTCDICLEDCVTQYGLSNHVWKHKLHHLCYQCSMTYRSKEDINKHLFWKHGTESTNCKRCLQKRWRHVYHFCIPPERFECDECQLSFSKAMFLIVHKRIHTGDIRYPCTEEECDEKFVSRRLLLKHAIVHQPVESVQIEKDALQLLPAPAADIESATTEPVDQVSEVDKAKLDADVPAAEDKTAEPNADTPRKRKKKNKALLDDLNFAAPNLSESDSSDDSDSDNKSNNDTMSVPNLMLSPMSDNNDKDEDENPTADTAEASSMAMGIWSNLMKFQQSSVIAKPEKNVANYTEDNYPKPKQLPVIVSDHDYTWTLANYVKGQAVASTSKSERKSASNKKLSSPCNSDSDSSSSGSGSSSDSSSSKSSRSSSSSGSSSSSSSSGSESSAHSANSKKRLLKKLERNRASRRSESVSPMKKQLDDANNGIEEPTASQSPTPAPIEPKFVESDYETAESDTDEDFYDEHPQKNDQDELARKRAQLLARTQLSPSHNFDILENSRPSTPSLPEDVALDNCYKSKKKKHDRRSTYTQHFNNGTAPALVARSQQLHNRNADLQTSTPYSAMHTSSEDTASLYSFHQTSSNMGMGSVSTSAYQTPHLFTNAGYLQASNRMSEGSSCSEADASLKRSKRQRRPNQFYGYETDDIGEHAQSIMIGTRAMKPTPPPNLKWSKEDLPSPSKSMFNRNKTRGSRSLCSSSLDGSFVSPGSSLNRKRHSEVSRNRKIKKSRYDTDQYHPPIPTLKIRSTQFSTPSTESSSLYENQMYTTTDEQQLSYSVDRTTDDNGDSSSSTSSDEEVIPIEDPTAIMQPAYPLKPKPALQAKQRFNRAALNHINTYNLMQKRMALIETNPLAKPELDAKIIQAANSLPDRAPKVLPLPRTKIFGTAVPPALLPNPNLETLEYFKLNNIRYPVRPPPGARKPREGESVYCYCRCPYDEVSEMIACDGDDCMIEWFHFECVGIKIAPKGRWYCAECRPKYMPENYQRVNT